MLAHPVPPFRLVALFVLLFMLAALASGCGLLQTKTVEVPIATSCIVTQPVVPDWETDHLTAQSTVYEKVRAALVELHQHRAYEFELVAVVRGCQ